MHGVVLAVEPSADLHASYLVKAIKEKSPGWTFSGLGGQYLKKEGVTLWEDFTQSSEMGVSSISSLKTWYGRIKRTQKNIQENLPDVVICVDSPDFNLRVAKGLRGCTLMVDYIAPSAWAWRAGRKKTVGELFDHVLVIWPFEKDFYEGCGAQVHFVGLPALDHLDEDLGNQQAPSVEQDQKFVALLPGSRPLEVKLNLPLFVSVAEELIKENPSLHFVIPKAPNLSEDLFECTQRIKNHLTIQEGGSLACLKKSFMGLIVNGTATIEAMLIGCPHVTSYAVTRLQNILYSPFIKTKLFNMTNVILNREVIPEILGGKCTHDHLLSSSREVLNNSNERKKQLAAFDQVRKLLGGPGVADRAADAILGALNG